MAKKVSLPMDLTDALDKFLHAGLDRTKAYPIIDGFEVAFRSLTGEEEIECRTAAGEFRGPAYIYTYKAKVLAYVICSLNGLDLPPGATVKVPKERTDEAGHVEEVLTDVPVPNYMEGIILTWSKGLIDICFKLWSKHQEDQLYQYMLPLGQQDLFSVEERVLAKEYERLLGENNKAMSEMSPQEMVLAAQNTTSVSDLVKIGANVVKQADPHIDFNAEEPEATTPT